MPPSQKKAKSIAEDTRKASNELNGKKSTTDIPAATSFSYHGKSLLLICIFFFTVAFIIYSNIFNSAFVFDDISNIVENRFIRMTEISWNQIIDGAVGYTKNRPVSMLSFAFNYYVGRYNPLGYHLINIIIHALTGIALFLFINTTLKLSLSNLNNRPYPNFLMFFNPSFWAAFLWLVHPLHTQTVTYIVQRMNSMAALFLVVSILLYTLGRMNQIKISTSRNFLKTENQRKQNTLIHRLWFMGSIISGLLALGSKESAAILPFLIFLYEWYFFQNLSLDWLKRNLKYFIGIILLLFLVALIFLEFNPAEKFADLRDFSHNEFTIKERILTQFRVVIYYISLIFYPNPTRLNLDYDFPLSNSLFEPVTTLLSLFTILGLVGVAVWVAKKERLISFCILWFFTNLVIESSIIPLAIIFEHRTYLPSMMICLLFVILVNRYLKFYWLKVALLILVLVIFSGWTYDRNRDWKNDLTIWTDTAKKSPEKARPHINLGKALANRDRLDEAINHYSIAVRIKPDYAKIHYNLGNAFAKKGKTQEAIERYNHALELKSKFPEVHNNLASVLAKQDKIDQAIAHFSEALRMKPDYAEAHFNLGGVLFKKGMVSEAIKHYVEALQLDPSYSEAHFNLGIVLEEQGRTDDAIKQYSEALKINPAYVEAQYNLAFAFHKQGKSSQAITHYESVLSIQPEYIPALNNLAVLYAIEGKYEMAVSLFKKTATLEPDNPGTYYNIARVHAIQGNSKESVDWLKKAIEKGYDDWQGIKTDDSFQNIRGSSEYKSLIEGH